MTDIVEGFKFFSNRLCADVPTQVEALSDGVSWWQVTTGNSLGTPCGVYDTLPLLPHDLWTGTTELDFDSNTLEFLELSPVTGTVPTEFGLLAAVTSLMLGGN